MVGDKLGECEAVREGFVGVDHEEDVCSAGLGCGDDLAQVVQAFLADVGFSVWLVSS